MSLTFTARNLPEMRSELEEYLRGDVCAMAARRMGVSDEDSEFILTASADLVEGADVFYASPDMSRLTSHAAKSLPGFSLKAEDVPCEIGMIFWGHDQQNSNSRDADIAADKVPMAAVGWRVAEAGGKVGLLLCLFIESEELIQTQLTFGMNKAEEISMRKMLPTVVNAIGHTAWVGFGDVDTSIQELIRTGGVDSDVLISTAVLKTAWLLMDQPLTEISTETASRASVKRMQRMGFRGSSSVRVIDVKKRSGGGSGSGREHRNQWLVNGHWRNQWYPSVQEHRPVWISPYLKGPEGAPILTGEKVYTWHRQ